MSVTSGFFNSLNSDRRYNAEQMSSIFDGVINDGIFASIGTAFSVTAGTGTTVTVGIGRAWFNSAWLYNDSILSVVLDAAEVLLNRYDAIVIEINHSDAVRNGSIKVVKGTPASTPSLPALTNTSEVHQYPLAYILRSANSTTITQANITNKIGTSDCPYVTGILQVQNIDNIVAQWEAEWNDWTAAEQADFMTWYNSLQTVLDGNVATNLTNRVLALESLTSTQGSTISNHTQSISDISDVLTDHDSQLSNSYFVCPYAHRVEVTTSGTWTVPDGVTNVDVFLVGGGAGGFGPYSSDITTATFNFFGCGGGGRTKLFKNISVTPGENVPIVIGSGGNGAIFNNYGTSIVTQPTAGGSTSFKSYSVTGGSIPTNSVGGSGGSGGAGLLSDGSSQVTCYGGVNGNNGGSMIYGTYDSFYVGGGKGDGNTTDPYDGTMYAPGGSAYAGVRGQSNLIQTAIGGGGNAMWIDKDLYSTSNASPFWVGKAGICVIYY